ncbi:MAG: peptide methionine sulfoxide reductase [Proteobacteria bacterium]|nr:peptide methionine sulfoxide reductase [Pseudomonadota bacterium]
MDKLTTPTASMTKIRIACAAIALALCLNARAESPTRPATGLQTAVFAGGCFWGVDAVFKHVKGVTEVESGYAGGEASTARYEKVSSGATGHAEAVRIRFDPAQVSYGQLLNIFFSVAHDPSQLNRQGPDVGSQYRSAVFFTDSEQQKMTLAYIQKLVDSRAFPKPVVTQVAALQEFYPAEKYHQNYLARHPDQPYIVYNDLPKLEQLRHQFPALYQ